MYETKKNNTKDSILETAAKFFSERGYDRVTTREIANDVGINPASLYYHFTSKEEILRSLYNYYSDELHKAMPDIEKLLYKAETDPPFSVLASAMFDFDEDKQEILDQIRITAVRRLGSDPESESFIRENVFGSVSTILQPLLGRLIELQKIKPLDIDTFIGVFSYYNFSAGILTNTSIGHNLDEYHATMAWLFSLIVPIEE